MGEVIRKIIKGKIKYVRNYTFHNINTLQMNPAMPYHDFNKPYVNLWFSSSDGHDVNTFNNLLKEENLDRLEQEHGVCIIYTHFSNGFVIDGVLNETTGKGYHREIEFKYWEDYKRFLKKEQNLDNTYTYTK